MLGLALAQLPVEDLQREILARADIGGCTHAFTQDCREADIRFSVGYELTETVRHAIIEQPEAAWVQAIDAGGEDRQGAWVAELADDLDLSAWPEGSRLIRRLERPHPGAQFTIFDQHGYWYMCFLTDQEGQHLAENAANSSVGRPAGAIAPSLSHTSFSGRAPILDREWSTPHRMSGASLEKISAPAISRDQHGSAVTTQPRLVCP